MSSPHVAFFNIKLVLLSPDGAVSGSHDEDPELEDGGFEGYNNDRERQQNAQNRQQRVSVQTGDKTSG